MTDRCPIPKGIIYLDYAATCPVAPEVLDAMLPYLSDKFGNPGTLYSVGAEARQAVEQSRRKVAELIGADDPNEILFTSGGTESDNAALRGGYLPGTPIACSTFEHHAVIDTCEILAGDRFIPIPVDMNGMVRAEAFAHAVPDGTSLVSVMHANNEIGTIQPIAELARLAHERGAIFHTDAVQSAGKTAVSVAELGVDMLSIAAHKIYGPKGVGALYVRRGTRFVPQQTGGGQERGFRGGTVNVAGVVGMAKALELAVCTLARETERLWSLNRRLVAGVIERIPDVRQSCANSPRVPHTCHFTFKGCEGESILLNLDIHGICCSAGAACSSGSTQLSHVLRAIGLTPEWGQGALRISLGRYTTEEQVDRVVDALVTAVSQVRSLTTVPHVTS